MIEDTHTTAEADPTVNTNTPNAAPAKHERGPNRTSTVDYEAGTITIGGGSFAIDDLPEASKRAMMLHGIRYNLRIATDPVAFFAELKAGRKVKSKVATPKADHWRDAAAHVQAEEQFKAAGGKALPKQKHRESPEYLVHFTPAREKAAVWDRSQLASAKSKAIIAAEHERLTGAVADVDKLFE